MTTFPDRLQDRLAKTIASTRRLADTAHQRLNTIGSTVAALQPGVWVPLTLLAGWSNLAGYIPAQVRLQQTGLTLLTGTITGGTTTNGTIIATLPTGFYSPTWSQSFTINVLAGAATVNVTGTMTGSSDTAGLPNGGLNGNSAYGQPAAATTAGTHYHGGGTLAVANGQHQHGSSALVPTVPAYRNTAVLTVTTSGNLTLTNCPAAATQISFTEHLPLA